MRLLVANHVDHLPEFKREAAEHFDVVCGQLNYSEVTDCIGDFEYLIPSISYRLDGAVLSQAARLKAISTPSTGTDHIDFELCKRLGVEVFSLKNDTDFLRGITATAELAMALMLNVIRQVPFAFQDALAGNWEHGKWRGLELQGKTLGILGFGRLGGIVADYALAFRMNVISCDPYKSIDRPGVKQVGFDELIRTSDIISIHVHLNAETAGMVGADEIGNMKAGAVIVNTSRGALIDSMALLRALEDGALAGAGLDVLDGELDGDIGSHPLIEYARTHQNVVITPHMGGVTVDSQRRAYLRALEKLIAFDEDPSRKAAGSRRND